MPGSALVRIGDREWAVAIATTPEELTRGLAGLASLPQGMGMLFALGTEALIPVTTQGMLFPIDILWLTNSLMVAELARGVPPGALVTPGQPARYFLEVNAGETDGIEVGVPVTIQLLSAPAAPLQVDVGTIVSTLAPVMVLYLLFGVMRSVALPAPREPAGAGLLMARTGAAPDTPAKMEQKEPTPKVYFIGSCKVSEGRCLTHNYPVGPTIKCPQSPLTDEEWKAAWELAETAFPQGMSNPWVNGWWPETLEEAQRAVAKYAHSMRDALQRFRGKQRVALEAYGRAADKAIRYYQEYVIGEYERRPGKAAVAAVPRLIGPAEKKEAPGELELFPDSPEQCCASVDGTGLRPQLDKAFREAIERARKGSG